MLGDWFVTYVILNFFFDEIIQDITGTGLFKRKELMFNV